MSGSLSADEPLVVLAGLEPRLAEAVRSALRDDGVETLDAERARTAATVRARRVTAVVLDASTQIADALGLCRALREDARDVPVVALARDDVDARIALLEDGADDCLSKPFAPRELVARIRALRRRTAVPGERDRTLEHADLRVDLAGRRAWRGGRELGLTRTEFALLTVLAQRAERVVTRKELLVAVWGFDYGPEFHSLGVYVGYLRRKLERDGEPRLLHTVRGVGYVLRADAT